MDEVYIRYETLFVATDTSRHYLPLPVMKNVIDSMTYTKLVSSFFYYSIWLVDKSYHL